MTDNNPLDELTSTKEFKAEIQELGRDMARQQKVIK